MVVEDKTSTHVNSGCTSRLEYQYNFVYDPHGIMFRMHGLMLRCALAILCFAAIAFENVSLVP